MNNMLLKLYVKFQDLASREEGQDLVGHPPGPTIRRPRGVQTDPRPPPVAMLRLSLHLTRSTHPTRVLLA